MARTFPTAGISPCDFYSTEVRPTGYFEHVITDDGTERHNVELIATPTMASAGNYVNLNIVTTLAGTAAAWVSSIYAKIIQGSTKRVNGYFCAAELELVNAAANASAMACLVLNWNSSVANAGSQQAYIILRDYSTAGLCNYFLSAIDGTVTTGGIFEAVTAAAASHGIKINWGGTDYWIMCSNSAA